MQQLMEELSNVCKNFIIKNGLTIGSTEAIDSSGDLTAGLFGIHKRGD